MITKKLTRFFIPYLGILYSFLASLDIISFDPFVVSCIFATIIIVSIIESGIDSSDGEMQIDTSGLEKDTYLLIFNKPLDTLNEKSIVKLRVKNVFNSSRQ